MATVTEEPEVSGYGDENWEESSLQRRLSMVQNEMRSPKGRRNEFGGFNYRNSEDILAAVKPIARRYGVLITNDSDIRFIEGRWYVKASAICEAVEGGQEPIVRYAHAREEESKKGMDASQITGSAESYAKKRALGNLLLLDDGTDADSYSHDPRNDDSHRSNGHSNGASRTPPRQPTRQTAQPDPKQELCNKVLHAMRSAAADREKLDLYLKSAEERFEKQSLAMPHISAIRREHKTLTDKLAGKEMPVSDAVKELAKESAKPARGKKTSPPTSM